MFDVSGRRLHDAALVHVIGSEIVAAAQALIARPLDESASTRLCSALDGARIDKARAALARLQSSVISHKPGEPVSAERGAPPDRAPARRPDPHGATAVVVPLHRHLERNPQQ